METAFDGPGDSWSTYFRYIRAVCGIRELVLAPEPSPMRNRASFALSSVLRLVRSFQRLLSSAFPHQALLLRPIHSNLPGVGVTRPQIVDPSQIPMLR